MAYAMRGVLGKERGVGGDENGGYAVIRGSLIIVETNLSDFKKLSIIIVIIVIFGLMIFFHEIHGPNYP